MQTAKLIYLSILALVVIPLIAFNFKRIFTRNRAKRSARTDSGLMSADNRLEKTIPGAQNAFGMRRNAGSARTARIIS